MDKFRRVLHTGFPGKLTQKDQSEISLLCSALRIHTWEGKQGGRKEAGRQKEMVGCDVASVKASADPTRSTEVGITSQSCSALMRGSDLKHHSLTVSELLARRQRV